MSHKSRVKKTNKVIAGANVQVSLNGRSITTATTIATGWNTIGVIGNTFTLKFDPLEIYNPDEVKKFKLVPLLDFMWLLRAVDIIDDNDISSMSARFKIFSKEYYYKGDQPPKNPYLKHIKQRAKNNSKVKRT